MPDPQKRNSYRKELVQTARTGNITLVLGAGISMPFGIPGWVGLAERLWQATFPSGTFPGDKRNLNPQFLPMVFERVLREVGEDRFSQQLSHCMYQKQKPLNKEVLEKSHSSLAVLARLLCAEFHAGVESRIHRVITLNADDCLERAVSALEPSSDKVLQPILTPLDHPDETKGHNSIEMYHLHGYIPMLPTTASVKGAIYKYDDMLIGRIRDLSGICVSEPDLGQNP